MWFCDREGSDSGRGDKECSLLQLRFCQNHGKSVATGGSSSGVEKGGKRANDSSVAAVHDVPGTPGKHLRAMLQCGSILIAEVRLCNTLLTFAFRLGVGAVTFDRHERKNIYCGVYLYHAARCARLASLTVSEQALMSQPEEVHVEHIP